MRWKGNMGVRTTSSRVQRNVPTISFWPQLKLFQSYWWPLLRITSLYHWQNAHVKIKSSKNYLWNWTIPHGSSWRRW